MPLADWGALVEAARSGGQTADLLTLAEEAPTHADRLGLLVHAAESLARARRFAAAMQVAEEAVRLAPANGDALMLRENVSEARAVGAGRGGARFGRVFAASGHMIDAPDRAAKGRGERFPPRKEPAVRASLARQLKEWGAGAGDLAICGGARGADILFAEICARRGAEVWLYLPLPVGEFLEKSVRLPGADWEARFQSLRGREGVKTHSQPERLGPPPKGASVFARNNLWMLNAARVEADDSRRRLYAVLVWDERPAGDGEGGTADFASRVERLGAGLAVINPTRL